MLGTCRLLLVSICSFTLILSLSPMASASLGPPSYAIAQSTGTDPSYDYTTTGTTVLSIPSEETYSSAQSLPFAWTFFGASVTQYWVSDNGYITFTDPGVAASDETPAALPSASEPTNAIFAFWSDLDVVTGSGTADQVKTWTYGEAGQQVHVIQWHSVTPDFGTGFVYAAIRIYECGDFDIVLLYANATVSGAVGAQDATGTVASVVAGSPSVPFPGTGATPTDDVVYTFHSLGTAYDLSVTSLEIETANPSSIPIEGTIRNFGTEPITSFTLAYTINGGDPVASSIGDLNIPPSGGIYNFSHPTLWTSAAYGNSYEVSVMPSLPNGNPDERTCNDDKSVAFFVDTGTRVDRLTLLEHFVGAWCGFCPDGQVFAETIATNTSGAIIQVDIHDGDNMEFAEGIRSEFGVSAYPNAMIDRKVFAGEADEPISRGDWEGRVLEQQAEGSPLTVELETSFDHLTRDVSTDVTVTFNDFVNGDLNIGCMVLEDSVTGAGFGYDQTNYLNTTVGHPFEGAGDPIVGYAHPKVLRAVPRGPLGSSGGFAAVIPQGKISEFTCDTTLDPGVDETKVSIVVFVSRDGTDNDHEILNAAVAALGRGSTSAWKIFSDGFETGNTTAW